MIAKINLVFRSRIKNRNQNLTPFPLLRICYACSDSFGKASRRIAIHNRLVESDCFATNLRGSLTGVIGKGLCDSAVRKE